MLSVVCRYLRFFFMHVCCGSVAAVVSFFFFFFKQKTAYEMLRSLVGSEMCIRDRRRRARPARRRSCVRTGRTTAPWLLRSGAGTAPCSCLLYTSDAADDLLCVDLGGRRIIKKKNETQRTQQSTITNHHHTYTITNTTSTHEKSL